MNKVVLHHGVHNLEKKQTKLLINQSNRNDILQLIGPPSTKSSFDNDVFIYIERKTSSSKLSKLGKKKLMVNNVLVLEIDRPDGLLDGNETLTEIKIDKINNDDEIPFSKFYLNELYVNITKKDTLIFLISKDYPDIFELRTLSGNLVN